MTFVDYGFFIIIIISTLLGCYRGFVRELLSIIAWFFAFYLAQSFSIVVASKLHWIDTESIRNLVAYFLIFFAVLVVSMGVITVLNKFIKYTATFHNSILSRYSGYTFSRNSRMFYHLRFSTNMFSGNMIPFLMAFLSCPHSYIKWTYSNYYKYKYHISHRNRHFIYSI